MTLGRLISLAEKLGSFAETARGAPLSRVHPLPGQAQLTHRGKARDALGPGRGARHRNQLSHLIETLRFHGCKGTEEPRRRFSISSMAITRRFANSTGW
jgi:hypothetical protein